MVQSLRPRIDALEKSTGLNTAELVEAGITAGAVAAVGFAAVVLSSPLLACITLGAVAGGTASYLMYRGTEGDSRYTKVSPGTLLQAVVIATALGGFFGLGSLVFTLGSTAAIMTAPAHEAAIGMAYAAGTGGFTGIATELPHETFGYDPRRGWTRPPVTSPASEPADPDELASPVSPSPAAASGCVAPAPGELDSPRNGITDALEGLQR